MEKSILATELVSKHLYERIPEAGKREKVVGLVSRANLIEQSKVMEGERGQRSREGTTSSLGFQSFLSVSS